MASSKESTLFKPLRVGNMQLQHRVVLAPMTRFRASEDYVIPDLAAEYYAQRASTPGTLLVTEATIIAPQAGGFPKVPGIWNEQQIAAYKKVAEAVHSKSSSIFLQLWSMGRPANAAALQKEGPYDVVGPSPIPVDDKHPTPRPLTVDEIKEYVRLYAQAAQNAITAGFDGVEVQCANGYLLDQFLQTNSNKRTDEYGGSIENRLRFVSEVLEAVTGQIGPERTGIRISPWSSFWGMRMPDPIPTFSALTEHLVAHYPRLAYLHVIEPRVLGSEDIPVGDESNEFVRKIWAPRPIILAGGFNRELAMSAADSKGETVLTAVGRHFTSNPDLPKRWLHDIPLTPYDRPTFASPGPKGYTDWPFHSEDVILAK